MVAPLVAAAIPALLDFIPDAVGWFKGDKAEEATRDVMNIARSVTGLTEDTSVIDAIKTDPNTALEFQKAVMKDKHRLDELYLQDRKDARDMQKQALSQDDIFSKRFIYYFASAWSFFAMAYLTAITFIPIPSEATRIVDTVLGFLLGTLISSVIQFFFGSSKGSKDKHDLTSEMMKHINKKE